jgi:hypothetical protein
MCVTDAFFHIKFLTVYGKKNLLQAGVIIFTSSVHAFQALHSFSLTSGPWPRHAPLRCAHSSCQAHLKCKTGRCAPHAYRSFTVPPSAIDYITKSLLAKIIIRYNSIIRIPNYEIHFPNPIFKD